jgi:hypothetical protein
MNKNNKNIIINDFNNYILRNVDIFFQKSFYNNITNDKIIEIIKIYNQTMNDLIEKIN